MLLAVPAMVRIAASISGADSSGTLIFVIFSACARVMVPTLSMLGIDDILSLSRGFLIMNVVGGVFMIKVKLLSAKVVIITGIGRSVSIFWVCALKALQNSIILRPR